MKTVHDMLLALITVIFSIAIGTLFVAISGYILKKEGITLKITINDTETRDMEIAKCYAEIKTDHKNKK